MQNYQSLIEFTTADYLKIAKESLPKGESAEYYQGAADGMAKAGKIWDSLSKPEAAKLLSAYLIEIEKLYHQAQKNGA